MGPRGASSRGSEVAAILENTMRHVLLAPYLPLSDRITVGPWRLIPFARLERRDALDDATAHDVGQLMDLYRSGVDGLPHLGALVHRSYAKVGARLRPTTMRELRRAVLLALLDANPSEESPNAAHMATSDNAVFYDHRLSGTGWVTAEYGQIVRSVEFGLHLEDERSEVRAPVELPRPISVRRLDPVYANAAFEVLTQDSDQARRLTKAVDWLDVAWRNSPSISQPTRIFALYSAFELIFNVGSSREKMALELSRRLDPPGARQRLRHWRTLQGKPRQAPLTDLAWWFMRFGDLRHALAHGRRVPDSAFRFGRRWHFWVAERRLREVITKLLVDQTQLTDLTLERGMRLFARAYCKGLPGDFTAI